MTTQAARFCPSCGTPREAPGVRFCRSCGAPFADAAALTLKQARRRPLWMVTLLTFLSVGFYQWIWLWASWNELKRIRDDAGMRPFWHSLAVYVPIYGLFRFHAHYRVLGEVLHERGKSLRVSPGVLTVGWLVSGVLGYAATALSLPAALSGGSAALETPSIPQTLVLIAAALLGAALVYVGQRGLNDYYAALPDVAIPWGTRPVEWILLVLFALLFVGQYVYPFLS